MTRAWRKRIGRAVLAALIALMLMLLIGQRRVGFVEQEPLGSPPHVVVQRKVPSEQLVKAMEETYDLLREGGADKCEFVFYSRNLLTGYTAPNVESVRRMRDKLIATYPDRRSQR